MNAQEYANLEQVEAQHWFYAGKRQIVLHWLRHLGALAPGQLLVDCGAGTGRFAAEVSAFCDVLAVDDHQESLEIARRRLRPEQVVEGSCTHLPLASGSADAITALDVIEHVRDDEGAVCEMARVLRPGGLMVITVPAFRALWSDWDVSLHHYRRYRRAELAALLGEVGLEIIACHYTNALAFPAVYLLRKWRARTGAATVQVAPGKRPEEKLPAPWLNGLLQALFVWPACQTAFRFPFGVGLLAVARRPAPSSPLSETPDSSLPPSPHF